MAQGALAYGGNSSSALLHIDEAINALEHGDSSPEQRGWVFQLAAHLYRLAGNVAKFEYAMEQAELAAEEANDPVLQRALQVMRAGDLRSDALVDDLPPAIGLESASDLIVQARLLRKRRLHEDALRALDAAEAISSDVGLRSNALLMRIGILLDRKEAGDAVNIAPLIADLPPVPI